MDYGKLAYLRSQELSKRIASMERASGTAYGLTGFAFRGEEPLAEGKTFRHLARASESGACQILLRVKTTSSRPATLRVRVEIAGVKALDETAETGEGARDSFFLVGAGVPNGTFALSMSFGGETTLLTYDLLLFGNGLEAGTQTVRLCLGREYVGVHAEETLRLYRISDCTAPERTLSCRIANLTATDDGDLLAFACGDAMFRTPIEPFCPEFLGDADDALCLSRTSLVTVSDGIVRSNEGGAPVRIPLPRANAVSLTAVADSARSAFVVTLADGRLYYKDALPAVSAARVRLGGAS